MATHRIRDEFELFAHRERWEARAEHDIALLILKHLADHPRPAVSLCADAWEEWSEAMLTRGRARLEKLGDPYLAGPEGAA